MSSQTVLTELAHIAERSECDPDKVFTALAHHMDVEFLTKAFHGLKRKAAAGIDQVTVDDYRKNLSGNLKDLHRRLVSPSSSCATCKADVYSQE